MPVSKGHGFDPCRSQLSNLARGQWGDSVSSARVDPVSNGYLEKPGGGGNTGSVG